MLAIAIFAVVGVIAVVSFGTLGWRATLTWILLFPLCLAPVTLARMSSDIYYGIGGAAPTLTSFAIVLVAVGTLGVVSGRASWLALLVVPLLLFCAFGMSFLWDVAALNWAGIEQYLLGFAAFAAMGFLIPRNGSRARHISATSHTLWRQSW